MYSTNIQSAVICSICHRTVPEQYQEKHHLIPSERKGETILVCTSCGDQLHQLFTVKELEKQFNTLDKILVDERVQKWIKWIRKKSDFVVCMKRKK